MVTTQKGFSLLEGVLAIFILTMGILPVAGLITSSSRISLQARDAITAAGLSQEGVELVRNVRDNNLAQVNGGASGADGFNYFPVLAAVGNAYCRIDSDYSYSYPGGKDVDCTYSSAGDSAFQLKTKSDDFYAHTGANSSKFYRQIVITPGTAGSGTADNRIMTVTSFVWWGNPSAFDTSGYPRPSTSASAGKFCTVSRNCVFAQVTLSLWQ